ncbi:MAG: hypothetical protein KatS3mg103_0644 [Phycisphaerales bacterium]|nr:MAG: hypothetical protein KatS3mg103_0644 [Phycisphaerales bacterium]
MLHVSRPSGSWTIPSAYALRTYDDGQWRRLVAQSPFEPVGCRDEEGRAIDPPRLGYALWLLRRPG